MPQCASWPAAVRPAAVEPMSKMPALFTKQCTGRAPQAAANARTDGRLARSSAATSSDGAGWPAAAAAARSAVASASPRGTLRQASTTGTRVSGLSLVCGGQCAPVAPRRARAAATSVPMPLP